MEAAEGLKERIDAPTFFANNELRQILPRNRGSKTTAKEGSDLRRPFHSSGRRNEICFDVCAYIVLAVGIRNMFKSLLA